VDFNTEVQPGDTFALAFERFVRDDGPTTYGVINAAEFQNEGRLVRAVRFTPPDGMPGYFDEQGRSLRRFFLRSPLKFEPRITSRYSLRRLHPVLRTARAHRGVDYGAPTGAPVVAVSSGTVISGIRADTSPTTCTCPLSDEASGAACTSSRGRRSASSAPPGSPRVRTCTTG
jgi:murein DD-endopeptidase MepM/ murein hydrolase activator NlpD